jgi:hypothetical protein
MKLHDYGRCETDGKVNGVKDPDEPTLGGWCIQLYMGSTLVAAQGTGATGIATFEITQPGNYTVKEAQYGTYVATTATSSYTFPVPGSVQDFAFGNVCLGDGTLAHDIDYWAGDGSVPIWARDLEALNQLPLIQANGVPPFSTDETEGRAQVGDYLLGSKASTDIACKLSAQLIALELNIRNYMIVTDRHINDNTCGQYWFITVADLRTQTITALQNDDSTAMPCLLSASRLANGNQSYVQFCPCPVCSPTPCPCPLSGDARNPQAQH